MKKQNNAMNRLSFPRKAIKLALLGLLLTGVVPVHALTINANYTDTSITGNANASLIVGAINTAIGTLEGLYGNNVSLAVNFTYISDGPSSLLSTNQYYDKYSYKVYTDALRADSVANPTNTVLATAIANLGLGNDANGSKDIVISTSLAQMLGLDSALPALYNPIININSLITNWAYTQASGSSSTYDLVGGLEHELNEVLGGGGAGSTLNSIASGGSSFFTSAMGPLDLYRYSAAGTSSFTTSGGASSYFSIDGGQTSIVAFNQNSNGDYGDFGPSCSPSGAQYSQNAFNCKGIDKPYTNSSPEFTMMQALGWFATAVTPTLTIPTTPTIPTIPTTPAGPVGITPEPVSIALMVIGGLGFGVFRKKQLNRVRI